MQLRVRSATLENITSDLLILPVWKGLKQQPELQELQKLWDGHLNDWLEHIRFEGNKREMVVVPCFGKLATHQVLLVGLGDRKLITNDDLRLIGG
ncbi:MAG TPA: M17 family peptidase N-terminal domain-containing protein, partial [bacterium]|nr:M17 family peptidase N-terminal domain-containing protein [bacterium]